MYYSKARTNLAMVGCAIILATGAGSTSVLVAVLPDMLVSLNTDLTSLMMGPALSTVAAFLASLVATKVIKVLTPKWSLLLGTVCVSAVLAMVAAAPNLEIWVIANVLNGVVLAFGAYASCAGVVAEFKGAKTPAVFGVVSGIAALLVSAEVLLEGQLLSIMSYHEVLYIFAGAILVIGILSNFFLIGKIPSKKATRGTQGGEGASARGAVPEQVEASKQIPALPGVTMGEALKLPAFYLFILAMFFGAWAINGATGYLTVFFTSFSMTTSEAAGFLSLLTAAIALYKFGSGWFIKKYGPKALAIVIFAMFSLGIACLLAWTQTQSIALAYVGVILLAFIGFVTIIPGLFIPNILGMKDYASLNAAGMAGFYMGGATLLFGLSVIIASIGISNAFIVLVVMAIIAMICLLAALALSPLKKQPDASEGK